MWHLLQTVQSPDVIQCIYGRGQASMKAENLQNQNKFMNLALNLLQDFQFETKQIKLQNRKFSQRFLT